MNHPLLVPAPGVGLPDPGWYLLYFALFCAWSWPAGMRHLLRAEPGQEEEWGKL